MRTYRSVRGDIREQTISCEQTSRAAAQSLRRRPAPVSSGGPARQEAGPDPARSEAPLERGAGAYVRERGLFRVLQLLNAAGASRGSCCECDLAGRQESIDAEISKLHRSLSDPE